MNTNFNFLYINLFFNCNIFLINYLILYLNIFLIYALLIKFFFFNE
jgi:hypothetical protein